MQRLSIQPSKCVAFLGDMLGNLEEKWCQNYNIAMYHLAFPSASPQHQEPLG